MQNGSKMDGEEKPNYKNNKIKAAGVEEVKSEGELGEVDEDLKRGRNKKRKSGEGEERE